MITDSKTLSMEQFWPSGDHFGTWIAPARQRRRPNLAVREADPPLAKRDSAGRTGRWMGLPDRSVDVAMVRHVLAHNGPTEQQIVDHLAAFVRPGGHLYLVDIDASMFRVRPSDPDVESLEETYRAFHAARGNDLDVGLWLSRLLTAAGLQAVVYRGWIQVLVPTGEFRPPAWAAREAMKGRGIPLQRRHRAVGRRDHHAHG
jgi:hypothetical protein